MTTFPDGFLWGASTSAHQTEGNNVASDWWAMELRDPPAVPDRSGDACDSYHRWHEDLDVVQRVGLSAYRFSVEWARIVPEPGHVSRAVLAHYRRVIEGCASRGITPIVTLHHFTSPMWFRALGGWTAEGAVAHFRDYVRAVLPILDGVEWICTINEPNIVASMEALRGGAARIPGADLAPPDIAVTEALFHAHTEARDLLAGLPGVRSGWTVANQNVQPLPDGAACASGVSWLIEDQFLDAAKDDDFIGVQAYTRTLVGRDGVVPAGAGARKTLTGWEFYPRALEDAIRHTAARIGGRTPIIVTENGIATADDDERIEYTREALHGLARAIADGIDVRGYLHWSLLDNYEWGRWSPTFGLVAVDRHTFARVPKVSAHWLGQVARTGDLENVPGVPVARAPRAGDKQEQ